MHDWDVEGSSNWLRTPWNGGDIKNILLEIYRKDAPESFRGIEAWNDTI